MSKAPRVERPRRRPRNVVLPAGPDVCPYCNRKVGPRGFTIEGQAVHKKCDREQRNS